jgi:hypothetical protein
MPDFGEFDSPVRNTLELQVIYWREFLPYFFDYFFGIFQLLRPAPRLLINAGWKSATFETGFDNSLPRFLGGGIEMPRIALKLTADERNDVRKLRAVLKKAGEHRRDLKLLAVQLLSEGTSVKQTAGICEVGTTTVKRWLHTYRVEGAWSLISR